MAQTKRKRRTKHRGNAAGAVEVRGRSGRPPSAEERNQQAKAVAKETRLRKKPTWSQSFKRALLAAAFMFLFILITEKGKNRVLAAIVVAFLAMVFYVPLGYWLEMFLWRRRMEKREALR